MTAGAGSHQRSQTCYYSHHGRGLINQSSIPQHQDKREGKAAGVKQSPRSRRVCSGKAGAASRQAVCREGQPRNQQAGLYMWKEAGKSAQLMIWSAGSMAKHRHTYDVAQAETKHPWLILNGSPEPRAGVWVEAPGEAGQGCWPTGLLRPPDISQWNIQTHIFMHKQEKRRIMIVVWPVLRFLTPECLIAQPRYCSNAVSTHSLYKHRGC